MNVNLSSFPGRKSIGPRLISTQRRISLPRNGGWFNCRLEYSESVFRIFVKNLSAFGRDLGLIQPVEKSFKIRDGDALFTDIEELLYNLKRDRINVAICVVNADRPDVSRAIKFFELTSGVVTVCVKTTSAIANKFKPVLSRIMHKLNARLGGTNFCLNYECPTIPAFM
jgi:hypothetical protein